MRPRQDPFPHKRTQIALKLWQLTRKNKWGSSFEELGVPFQWCGLMDLRERGVVSFTICADGKCGAYLLEPYASMPLQEFHLEIKRMFNQKIYE